MDAELSRVSKCCELCQNLALYRCAGCRRLYYCSKQHQSDHWNYHKPRCKAFKIEENARSLTATRDVDYGEFILQEDPLVWGPSFNTVPVCLGCGKKIDENCRPCYKCGWPICDDLCEKSPGHIPECQYTIQKGQKVNIKTEGLQPIYKCVIILRCLYIKQFLPKIWKKLEHLPHGTSSSDQTIIANFIRRFFKLWAVFSMNEVLEVCGMVMMNAQEVPLTDPPYFAMYSTASLLQHNCTANCTKSFSRSGQILITAATKIQDGDQLTISYIDSCSGTQNRRLWLHKTKSFWCCCQRCQDPTEFNTNFSALKCQSLDCVGCLLPASFINIQKLSDWTCNKCPRSISSYSAHDILERIEQELNDLDKTQIDVCKNFLETFGSYLHENHFYLFNVKLALCQMVVDGLTDEDLGLKLRCCQSLEKIIKVIAPAEKRVLGRVLFEKCLAVAEMGRRVLMEKIEIDKEVKKILLDVVEVLKDESEMEIFKRAREILKELKC